MKAWHGYSPRELLELGDFELCKEWVSHVLRGDKGGFLAKLLDAAMIADLNNMSRLMEGFPDEIGLVIWYKSGMNPEKLAQMREAQSGRS